MADFDGLEELSAGERGRHVDELKWFELRCWSSGIRLLYLTSPYEMTPLESSNLRSSNSRVKSYDYSFGK